MRDRIGNMTNMPFTDDYGYLATDAWIQVNIRRSVNGSPMSADNWNEFQNRVISALVRYTETAPIT